LRSGNAVTVSVETVQLDIVPGFPESYVLLYPIALYATLPTFVSCVRIDVWTKFVWIGLGSRFMAFFEKWV